MALLVLALLPAMLRAGGPAATLDRATQPAAGRQAAILKGLMETGRTLG